MGRKKVFEFEKYVSYDKENNISVCILCQRIFKGRLSGNIRRHYDTIHHIKIKETKHLKRSPINSPSSSSSVSKKQNDNIQICLSKNEFLLCCVGLVAIKNIPFEIFDDTEYFKKILRPYEDLHKTNLNSSNIISKMNTVANEIKQIISKSVLKKMICLKIDVATRTEKSILGINIQYIEDEKININTIGIIQLKKRHTAQFIKEEIINCLNEFNIDYSQIYACTSDNGEVLAEDSGDPVANDKDFDKIHSSLSSVLDAVRCVTHAIQLTAHDVLKTIQPELNKCRKIVKNICIIIKNKNSDILQMPLIDNVTRWNSTYKMIKSLQNLKDYAENTNDLNNSDLDWSFIENFLKAFQPLSECSRKFELEQYIIGDFYRDWLCCEVELEDMVEENCYAQNLLNAMKKRKQSLFLNETFLSALYLDPRFNFFRTPFLSEEHKIAAMNHLLKTYEMIKHLSGQPKDIKLEPISNDYLPSYSGSFSKLEARINLLIEQTPSSDITTKQKLENLCNADRIPFDSNILEYWKNVKISDPELGKLLDVALSVPVSQVSFEKTLSALSLILPNMKSNLSKDTINNLLLVKLNKSLIFGNET